jgi:hypothetical protein
MTTITLKNIPPKIYSDLKTLAKNTHRSLNGEILFALQLHIARKSERPGPEEVIRKAREFRAKVKGIIGTEEIEQTISDGQDRLKKNDQKF